MSIDCDATSVGTAQTWPFPPRAADRCNAWQQCAGSKVFTQHLGTPTQHRDRTSAATGTRKQRSAAQHGVCLAEDLDVPVAELLVEAGDA